MSYTVQSRNVPVTGIPKFMGNPCTTLSSKTITVSAVTHPSSVRTWAATRQAMKWKISANETENLSGTKIQDRYSHTLTATLFYCNCTLTLMP
jgi:hypothetical protein